MRIVWKQFRFLHGHSPPRMPVPFLRQSIEIGSGFLEVRDVHWAAMKRSEGSSSAGICVLGIDPAAAGPTGYGVIETDGKGLRMLRFGALRARRELAAPERLREIHDLLAALIEEFSPAAVAVEAPFTALNRKTAQRLAEVRGVVLMTAAESGVPVHSYSPREVKASVTGYGGADKIQMQQMVRATLSLSELPEPADAADALAVALCHIFCARSSAKLTVSAGNAPGARNRPRSVRIQQGR